MVTQSTEFSIPSLGSHGYLSIKVQLNQGLEKGVVSWKSTWKLTFEDTNFQKRLWKLGFIVTDRQILIIKNFVYSSCSWSGQIMFSKLMRIVISTWSNYMHELKPQIYLILFCTSADDLSSYITEIIDAIQNGSVDFHPYRVALCPH